MVEGKFYLMAYKEIILFTMHVAWEYSCPSSLPVRLAFIRENAELASSNEVQ